MSYEYVGIGGYISGPAGVVAVVPLVFLNPTDVGQAPGSRTRAALLLLTS